MNDPKQNDNRKKSPSANMPIGMCMGAGVGTVLGIFTNNLGLWLPIGVACGMSLGLGLSRIGAGRDKDGEEKKP